MSRSHIHGDPGVQCTIPDCRWPETRFLCGIKLTDGSLCVLPADLPHSADDHENQDHVSLNPMPADWKHNLAGNPYGMHAINPGRGLHQHGDLVPHSHEVRPDHQGVPRITQPMKVHGPLDTPAAQHNKQAELDAVRVLQDRLAGPSMRHDAEAVLVALGWPELAVRVVKGERP